MRVHHFGHRYAKQHETPKDMLTYHAALLLEWDHGEYVTSLPVTSYELQVYELRVTSYKLQATSYKLQATSCKLQVSSHKLQATSY